MQSVARGVAGIAPGCRWDPRGSRPNASQLCGCACPGHGRSWDFVGLDRAGHAISGAPGGAAAPTESEASSTAKTGAKLAPYRPAGSHPVLSALSVPKTATPGKPPQVTLKVSEPGVGTVYLKVKITPLTAGAKMRLRAAWGGPHGTHADRAVALRSRSWWPAATC